MSKVANMATREERDLLSKNIKDLKEECGLTYAKLNSKLGGPCKTSTLQIRAAYPSKPMSKKLLDKINFSIKEMQSTDTHMYLENLKKEAMKEVNLIMGNYFSSVEEHLSSQHSAKQ